MDLTPGYNLSASTVERLGILDWIYDQAQGRPRVHVNYGSLAEQSSSYGVETLDGFLSSFEREGWVTAARTLGWSGTACYLNQEGVDFIDDVRRRRGNTVGRVRAARDALLQWLYERKMAGESNPQISGIHTTGYGYYYGLAFSQVEVQGAAEWLAEYDFIKGVSSWQAGIIRPGITAKGQSVVESGRSVNDSVPSLASADVPPPTSITIDQSTTVHGTGNVVAAHSAGASQQVSVTADQRSQVVQVADALSGMLDALGLAPQDAAEARQVADDLRTESAAPAPDRGRVRKLLDRVTVIGASASNAALGAAVGALAKQAIETWGS